MKISRRQALTLTAATALAAQEKRAMYGLIAKMQATPGKRDELAAILIEGSSAMSGCLSYVVAKDGLEPNALWITEVWESEAAHQASLALPAVKRAIAKGRPLIASFDERHITQPLAR